MGRNPQTGKAIKIKAKIVVRLRPSKALKDAVLKGNGWPD
jgi:nucleoid DNA-binding protein